MIRCSWNLLKVSPFRAVLSTKVSQKRRCNEQLHGSASSKTSSYQSGEKYRQIYIRASRNEEKAIASARRSLKHRRVVPHEETKTESKKSEKPLAEEECTFFILSLLLLSFPCPRSFPLSFCSYGG
ncbi:hypothetical protein AVEN_189066-1 [Araneus ventricosus]|uniref:Uncharacterized protein n=1 Tax=Araneus ventricosus TaxID=182803 RepID=A0A4Y2JIX0_ARAVE|nr:hypothetical protein AVEN_189066-1 [Araneus ventricosus]